MGLTQDHLSFGERFDRPVFILDGKEYETIKGFPAWEVRGPSGKRYSLHSVDARGYFVGKPWLPRAEFVVLAIPGQGEIKRFPIRDVQLDVGAGIWSKDGPGQLGVRWNGSH